MDEDKPSGSAIVALVLGTLSFLGPMGLFGLPAWIIGRVEIRRIDAGASPRGGRSIALIGMILGIITTVISAFVLVIGLAVLPLFVQMVRVIQELPSGP